MARRENLKNDAASRIREQIFAGELRPGEKVNQDRLASELGMSKLPVREALISLEAEGLISGVPRRGAFVAKLTPDDVRDHFRIYGLLAALAAQRAAEALAEDELDELQQIHEKMVSSHSSDEQEQLNFEFHRIINEVGGSRRLRAVLRTFSNTIPARFFEHTTGWPAVADEQHQRLLAALRARDPEAAFDAMLQHLSSSGEHAVKILRGNGFWDHEASG